MHKLNYEYQAYSEAADALYSRAGDCTCEHMSNSYIKIADRLERKATSLFKKISLDKPTSKKILTHTTL